MPYWASSLEQAGKSHSKVQLQASRERLQSCKKIFPKKHTSITEFCPANSEASLPAEWLGLLYQQGKVFLFFVLFCFAIPYRKGCLWLSKRILVQLWHSRWAAKWAMCGKPLSSQEIIYLKKFYFLIFFITIINFIFFIFLHIFNCYLFNFVLILSLFFLLFYFFSFKVFKHTEDLSCPPGRTPGQLTDWPHPTSRGTVS